MKMANCSRSKKRNKQKKQVGPQFVRVTGSSTSRQSTEQHIINHGLESLFRVLRYRHRSFSILRRVTWTSLPKLRLASLPLIVKSVSSGGSGRCHRNLRESGSRASNAPRGIGDHEMLRLDEFSAARRAQRSSRRETSRARTPRPRPSPFGSTRSPNPKVRVEREDRLTRLPAITPPFHLAGLGIPQEPRPSARCPPNESRPRHSYGPLDTTAIVDGQANSNRTARLATEKYESLWPRAGLKRRLANVCDTFPLQTVPAMSRVPHYK